MAKLFTHHDRFHSHALVGGIALIHYFYRFVLVCWTGTSFPEHENRWFQTACVLLHVLLPLLSFQIPLPAKRNPKKPMIWHEGRWHSLIFATRHVIATLCSLWCLWPNPQQFERFSSAWWYTLAGDILAKQALTVTTCRLAKIVSDKYGDRIQRTTNSMPYPDNVDEEQQLVIKRFYSSMQFAATSLCLIGDPTAAFWPLFAIQGATFLMTLVRKGFVSAATYHRGYALQLRFNCLVFLIRAVHGMVGYDQIFAAMLALHFTLRIRFVYGYSAVECWMVGVAANVIGWELIGDGLNKTTSNVWSKGFLMLYGILGSMPLEEQPLFFGGSSFQKCIMNIVSPVPSEAFRPSVEKQKTNKIS